MGLDIFFKHVQSTEVGYFRKVNFLVGFFTEILGKEIENLEPVEISKEDCVILLDRCNKVLENHDLAEHLLPAYPGFFFGNYEYNDDYFKDVAKVKEYVKDRLLPLFDNINNDEKIEFQIWY